MSGGGDRGVDGVGIMKCEWRWGGWKGVSGEGGEGGKVCPGWYGEGSNIGSCGKMERG